jgi:hypothetical protein
LFAACVAAFVIGCSSDDTSDGGEDAGIDAPTVDSTAEASSGDSSTPDAGQDAEGDSTIQPDVTLNDATLDAGDAEDASDEGDSTIQPDGTLSDAQPDGTLSDAPTDTSADVVSDVASDVIVDASDGGTVVCGAFECPSSEKLCFNKCVVKTDLTYGCDPSSCGLGCTLTNASSSCSGTSCTMGSCHPGFADCDNDPSDGCEVDLSDPANCTACGNACGTGKVCTSTGCANVCTGSDTQCGFKCFDLNTSIHACGSCNTPCTTPHGTGTCSGGTCTITCDTGYSAYNKTCVDTQNDVNHCGSVLVQCNTTQSDAFPYCNAGTCDIGCNAGFTKCGGACINTLTDPNNCGSCGTVCGTSQWCISGSCQAQSVMQVVGGIVAVDLAVDANNIYWTDTSNAVWKADKATFTSTQLASSQSKPTRIAVNSTDVFWINGNANTIATVPIGGGSVATLTSTSSAYALTADDNSVFWSETNTLKKIGAAVDGGTSTTLTSTPGNCSDLGNDSSDVWCLVSTLGFWGMYAFDKTSGTTTYTNTDVHIRHGLWVNPSGGCTVKTISQTDYVVGSCGQSGTVVFPGIGPSVVGDTCGVYWSDGQSKIWWFPITSSNPKAIPIAAKGSTTGTVVQDADYVYWIDTNWIGRVHK